MTSAATIYAKLPLYCQKSSFLKYTNKLVNLRHLGKHTDIHIAPLSAANLNKGEHIYTIKHISLQPPTRLAFCSQGLCTRCTNICCSERKGAKEDGGEYDIAGIGIKYGGHRQCKRRSILARSDWWNMPHSVAQPGATDISRYTCRILLYMSSYCCLHFRVAAPLISS